MYITINGTQYPCANYRDAPGTRVVFYGVEGLTLPISGEVSLHADNGFELARQNAGSYARQTYESGVLTLTNEPEPEPVTPEDPPPAGPTPAERITTLEQQNSTLAAQIEATNTLMDFYEECIVELAMVVYG